MIIKVYRAFMASYYLAKAFSCSSRKNDDKALYYLDKSKAVTPKEIFSDLLLRGFLYSEKKRYSEAIRCSEMALQKIESSKRLNIDEKIYLSAYARDTINISRIRMGETESVTSVPLNFDVKNVRSIYKNRFKVIIGRRTVGTS